MGDGVRPPRRSAEAPRPVRGGRIGSALAVLALALILPATACGGKKKPATRPGTPAPGGAAPAASPAPIAAAGTPVQGLTVVAGAGTPRAPFTPRPGTPIAAVTPTPAAAATPGVRTENGLQIQDVQFQGRVAVSGGLRIRSKPDASSNVVASVPEGWIVDVQGKVLNGAEAEPGKGTVWYIVGTNQYLYGAEGYIVPIGTPVTR